MKTPTVEIRTRTNGDPTTVATGANTEVLVNGESWPVIEYRVEGKVNHIQTVTITFRAELTVTRD
jgi:hypothetical protein